MTEIDDIEFGDSEIESEPTPGPKPRIRVTIPDYDCYSQLWLAVLLRAVEDASLVLPEPKAHHHDNSCPRKGRLLVCTKRLLTEDHKARLQAQEWFVSTSDDVGSLLWLCSMMDLEPEVIRRELRKRVEANREDARLGRTGANRTYPRAVLHQHTRAGRPDPAADARSNSGCEPPPD